MIMTEKKLRVLLDAGHYGKYNRSPAVPEYYESDFTWKYHLLLKAELENYGMEVDTTREDKDKDLAVVARGSLAKNYDLFLSLHSDAFNETVDHASVFGAYDDLNDAHVLGGMLASAVALAMGVSKGYYKTQKSGKGDWEYYGVLRGARNSGCPLYYIIEHSFHTNPNVARWLLNEENLKMLAEIEADAIAEYFGIEKPYAKGDVNGDGKVDSSDYLLAKRIAFGTYKPTDEEFARCDVNGDGKVDALDYIAIKRLSSGTYKEG
jgi:N-acetylmuramoyl-L-alanine amidase